MSASEERLTYNKVNRITSADRQKEQNEMTYVPSSSTLPPRMPGAAKPPFWTKGKLFLVGMVAP